METTQNVNVDKYQSFHLLGEKIEVKSCPKCNSYFLTDKECESCGLQLDYDYIGRPFGEKSVFYQNEIFVDQLNLFEKMFPHNFLYSRPKSLKYKRYLLKRLKDLCDSYDYLEGRREYLLLECRQIVNDYIEYGGDFEPLFFHARKCNFSDLIEYIENKASTEDIKKAGFSDLLFNRHSIFWGKLLFIMSMTLSCSLILYYYLSN